MRQDADLPVPRHAPTLSLQIITPTKQSSTSNNQIEGLNHSKSLSSTEQVF